MKSAYAVLGIPGNAGQEEVEASYLRATQHYSHERMVEDAAVIGKLMEIKEAYKLLIHPELRAAHDRKLSAAANRPAPAPRVVLVQEEVSWFSQPIYIIALLVIALFVAGGYMSYARQQAKKEQVARELVQQKRDAEAALLAQQRQDQIEAGRARAAAESERKEQQFRIESNYAASRASSVFAQQQVQASRQIETDRRNEQQLARDAKNEERQRVYEAERRVAADKQRVRELCYLNYRRYDC